MLHAAFGKFDMTPPPGAVLGRLVMNRLVVSSVKWPLHLRAAMFESGGRRVVVVVLDVGFMFRGVIELLRDAVFSGCGVRHEDTMISATHTHNGPMLNVWSDDDRGYALAESIAARLSTLVGEMAARLEPARLIIAKALAPGWSWNRRPIYARDGAPNAVGTHGKRGAPGFVEMEGTDEATLSTLLAQRADGTAIGGLVNFWCHPTTMYAEHAWSADFPGPLLAKMERHFNADFVYLTGPCGDLSNNGGLENGAVQGGPAHGLRMGEAIADEAIKSLAHAVPVIGDAVRTSREFVTLAQRMITSEQVKIARDYLAHPRAANTPPPSPSLMQRLHGWPFHFAHQAAAVDDWLAQEVVSMRDWQRRVGDRVAREQVEVQAIAVGDFALASVPCELFSALGHELVQRSPMRHTMAVELANGFAGYVPPESAFKHGGYECCVGLQSRLEPRAGHLLVDRLVHVLGAVAG